jgi:hypothetical protein
MYEVCEARLPTARCNELVRKMRGEADELYEIMIVAPRRSLKVTEMMKNLR